MSQFNEDDVNRAIDDKASGMKDLRDQLSRTVKDLGRVCERTHLPTECTEKNRAHCAICNPVGKT